MIPLWSDLHEGQTGSHSGFGGCAGADGQQACMAAIELPADLHLSPSPPDAVRLQHVLRERFRIEASLQDTRVARPARHRWWRPVIMRGAA